MDTAFAVVVATARLLAIALGPLLAVAAALHFVELRLSRRLVSRLGWHGVLLTGWIGVPVHELSHAAACLIFRHRIESLRLFAPDARTGRLGEVRHAWDRRSLYQQVGRFFIGVAPLAGGALALWALTRGLGPGWPVPAPAEGVGLAEFAAGLGGRALDFASALFAPESLSRGVTWLYLYLALCIGAHMSPSAADLRGGGPGLALLGVLVGLALTVVALSGGNPRALEAHAAATLEPVLTLAALALSLGLLCWALVVLITLPFPERRA